MKNRVKPQRLRPGDTIGVVAPASNIKQEMFTAGVEELRRLGYRLKYNDSITSFTRYTAGTVERRSAELNQMLLDPEVNAVFAARGGYGSMHLLELLDPQLQSTPPKIVMGYSDITALLIALYQKYSWVTFHGPMVAKDFAGGESHYDRDSFSNVLTRASAAGALDCSNTTVLWKGKARGRLLGGCLPLVVSLIGTPWELETEGSILFLEDMATKPFQLDRMITQLRLAGKFRNVCGIVFGEMAGCLQHPNQGYRLEEVLSDLTADLGVPVLFGLRSGHSEVGNITLPLGVEVFLDCDQVALSVMEAAVED
jgi:muramoyltetrapeptide carboxypeptidase